MKWSTINGQENSHSFIAGWYINPDVCTDLIAEFGKLDHVKLTSHPMRGYTVVNGCAIDSKVKQAYTQEVDRCLEMYKKQYPRALSRNMKIVPFHDFNVQRYEPGKYYSDLHCENNGMIDNYKRVLAFMTYLNDISFEGGTHFPYQNLTVKPQKGLTLIWPAQFTHIHRGVPAPQEVKYIATGWYEFEIQEPSSDNASEDFYGDYAVRYGERMCSKVDEQN